MTGVVESMAAVYLNIGFTGLFVVVVLALVIWYFTKGRKQSDASKLKLAEEIARNGKIIENCTEVIRNNTAVIEANTLQRQDEKRSLDKLDERMARHGEQHDEMLRNQAVAMALQGQKSGKA